MNRVVCKLKDVKEYEQFISKYKYVIIKASASWCGPCHRIKELFNSLVSFTAQKPTTGPGCI